MHGPIPGSHLMFCDSNQKCAISEYEYDTKSTSLGESSESMSAL